jgi:hypothetical protein
MNKLFFVVICILIGVTLAALTLYFFFPESCGKQITCEDDAQCGGEIIGERFCQGNTVYGNGQVNTCIDAGTCNARCETSYATILIEECANGCSNGACT